MKEGYTITDLEFPEILGSLEGLKADGRSRTSHLRCSNSIPETLLGFSSSGSNEPSHPAGTSFFGAPAPAPGPVATCTCLVRYVIRDEFLLEKMREFDLDVICASPIYKSRNLFVHTCIGDAENLNKLLRQRSTFGEVQNVIFEEASFSGNDPLSRLTPRQRDLLIAAKRHGYYEYPRRINSQQLAEKLDISKATAIEHLRKGEARLISTLLTGY
ncbi:MAG: hypothetical protein PWR21_951 [Methanoculleus sp.]|nr:hypothetical protein [Methanoculleus sp.]MDK2989372.1 hypothetical protein [Methanoculleus sp.]